MKNAFHFSIEEIGQALIEACLKKLPHGKYDFHYDLYAETKDWGTDFTALVIYKLHEEKSDTTK